MCIEEGQCAVLDNFILDRFRIEFDPEVEEQGLLPPDPLAGHLLLHVQPALVVVNVRELETKIPLLPNTSGLKDIFKQFPAKSCLFYPELCKKKKDAKETFGFYSFDALPNSLVMVMTFTFISFSFLTILTPTLFCYKDYNCDL